MAETRILLPSVDAARRAQFFQDALGLQIERQWDDEGNTGWLLRAGGEAFVEVLAQSADYPAGPSLGVQLVLRVDDVDHAVTRAQAAGARLMQSPEDKPWGSRNAQIQDPEGLTINLFSRND